MLKKTTTAALLLTIGATSLVAACASGPALGANEAEASESEWEQTKAELGQRAGFELSCPSESLEFTLFKQFGRKPTEVGVSGCGERITFVRVVKGETIHGYVTGPWRADGA